ncbi:MAG: hypothetical protein FWG02_06525 [Holophagaceae bacterium]|nr:hypothetical protein [Holophagaceae bacterium]
MANEKSIAILKPKIQNEANDYYSNDKEKATRAFRWFFQNEGHEVYSNFRPDVYETFGVPNGYQSDKLYDENIAIEIGKHLKVQLVCISEIGNNTSGACFVNCKIIDVEAGKIISAGSVPWDRKKGGLNSISIPCEILINKLLDLGNLRAVETTHSGNALLLRKNNVGDVYVAGFEHSPFGYKTATLWKNGKPQRLCDGKSTSEAKSVFVAGNDVYVAGFEEEIIPFNPPPDPPGISVSYLPPQKYVANVWKNGKILYRFVQSESHIALPLANSVFVSDGDVYVAGRFDDKPALWKNGEPQFVNSRPTLRKNGEAKYPQYYDISGGEANDVFVAGGNVYLAGKTFDRGKIIATLWKNGDFIPLSDGKEDAEAYSVSVSGNNVYVTGRMSNGRKFVPALWKNGEFSTLGDGVKNGIAYSVFASGDDVYVAGHETGGINDRYSFATVWKNGNIYYRLSGDQRYGGAQAIFLNGKDVYVVGYESVSYYGGYRKILLWKNGAIGHFLPIGSKDRGFAGVYSVFAK